MNHARKAILFLAVGLSAVVVVGSVAKAPGGF